MSDTNGKIIHASDDSFEQDVIKSEIPTLVDFWAPWCGPCKAVGPVLEELAEEYEGRVRIVKVNTDEHPGVAGALNIRSIPTLILFKDGKVSDMKVGAAPKPALASWLEGHAN